MSATHQLALGLSVLGLTAVAALGWARPAQACSSVGLEPFVADSALDDTAQPDAIGETTVVVRRGKAPICKLGNCSSSSCDDIGSVALSFALPTDNQTASEALAYRIELVDGDPVDGLIPDFVFRSPDPGTIFLQWADEASDDQEPLAFTVVIYTVDEAGNESPASAPIEISDPGSSDGCRVAPRGRSSPMLWALLPLLALARRRPRG